MRIGIDCRLWSVSTGRYVRELVGQLSKIDQKNEYVLFLLREDFDKPQVPTNFKKVAANFPIHSFVEQFLMPFIALKEQLDIFHVPYINVPILYPKKFITTIHDLTILRVDTGRASTRSPIFYKTKRLGFRIALWVCVFRSAKIITVSAFVKKDIIGTFGIGAEKVVVAPNGISPHFHKRSTEEVSRTLDKYKINTPYIFYVGNAHPHKNVEGLLRAFEKVWESRPEMSLVLGGDKKFFYERLESEWRSHPVFPHLNFTGFIDDKDLPAVYSGAEVFVNPSKSEGFGLQLLEAFACGTKVACSNVTSLPEVGGDAAYYFDPENVENMSETIRKALNDKSGKKVELGHEQAKRFSWERFADIHLKTYTETK